MKIMSYPTYEILRNPIEANRESILESARLCFKSESAGRESDSRLLTRLVEEDDAMTTPIEMADFKVRITTDRGIANEFVRHRIASFNQESTRYCNYSLGKFGHEITVVKPFEIREGTMEYYIWEKDCERAEKTYFDLLDLGVKPETARAVLPTCLATTIDIKANLREWYHILKQRTSRRAHPDARLAMHGILLDLAAFYPELFKSLAEERNPQFIEDFAKKDVEKGNE